MRSLQTSSEISRSSVSVSCCRLTRSLGDRLLINHRELLVQHQLVVFVWHLRTIERLVAVASVIGPRSTRTSSR